MKYHKHHRGALLLAIEDDGTPDAFYPDPSAGTQTTPDGYNYSTTSTDSPFDAGTKDVLIYSITVSGAGVADWALELHGGSHVGIFRNGGSSIGQTYSFGPEGIRLPGGFRISSEGSTGSRIAVAYEVV